MELLAITRSIEDVVPMIERLYAGRAWVALGYSNWQALIDARLGMCCTASIGLFAAGRRDCGPLVVRQ